MVKTSLWIIFFGSVAGITGIVEMILCQNSTGTPTLQTSSQNEPVQSQVHISIKKIEVSKPKASPAWDHELTKDEAIDVLQNLVRVPYRERREFVVPGGSGFEFVSGIGESTDGELFVWQLLGRRFGEIRFASGLVWYLIPAELTKPVPKPDDDKHLQESLSRLRLVGEADWDDVTNERFNVLTNALSSATADMNWFDGDRTKVTTFMKLAKDIAGFAENGDFVWSVRIHGVAPGIKDEWWVNSRTGVVRSQFTGQLLSNGSPKSPDATMSKQD